MNKLKYPLETERLILRPAEMSDVDAVYEYRSQEEVVRYTPITVMEKAKVAERVGEWVERLQFTDENDAIVVLAVRKSNHVVIGDLVLFLRDEEARQGELGYVFNPSYGGQGYATEAAREVMRAAFEEMNFHRISTRCSVANTASWKLMERLGMRREAHFIEDSYFKGEWNEEYRYALLQREWNAMNKETA